MVRGRGDAASARTGSDDETDAPSMGGEAASADQLTRGTVVGRYTVLSLVGRGGMSEVYGAYDPALDRKVALKVLHRGSGCHDAQQSRLHREGRAIAQISHPNVIAVHEVGTFGDRVFIAIAFVEGQTLRDWLRERPRSRGEILAAFLDAARGLGAAHAKGLIHRDFKPQNVLVGNDGVVRVTDFGLARWIDEDPPPDADDAPPPRTLGVDLTNTGQLVGTPLYMAPEQLDGAAMDARTDQFSFCVALYEALYGAHPFFPSGSATTLAAAIRAGQVRPPSDRGAVPTWQRRAILRGLSVAPAARWPSIDELVAALTTDPARKRRRRWLALGAAALAVAGAASALRTRARNETAVCNAGQSGLDGIWGPSGRARATDARRSAVHAAFLATGASTATEVWEHVASALDRYADEWLRIDRDSCEATVVRHAQPAAVMDQRSACLADRRDALEALVDVLRTADAPMMPRAVDAVNALPALDLCAASRSPHALATPGDPALRARVDDIRRRALAARAQHDAGRDPQAIARATALLAEARGVGYPPLVAELLSLIGSAKSQLWDPSAPAVLEETIWVSLRAKRDDLAAPAAALLAAITSDYLQRPAEGAHWTRLSEALVDRLGDGNERLRSWLLNDQAIVRQQSGDLQEGLQLAREALALKREVLRADDPDIARTLMTEAETLHQLGDDRTALAEIEKAYRLLVAAYGPSAVIVAVAQSNRGEYLAALGQFDAALASFQEALSRWQTQVGPDTQVLAYPLTGLGTVLLALGRPSEARPPLERAWRIRERSEPSPGQRGATAFALARAAWETGDRRRSRALAQTARANYNERPTLYGRQMREVDLWLAGHS